MEAPDSRKKLKIPPETSKISEMTPHCRTRLRPAVPPVIDISVEPTTRCSQQSPAKRGSAEKIVLVLVEAKTPQNAYVLTDSQLSDAGVQEDVGADQQWSGYPGDFLQLETRIFPRSSLF